MVNPKLDDLIRVVEVRGEIISKPIMYGEGYISVVDTRITCVLEDNRLFFLERVPPDIVISLRRLDGEDINDERERFVDILLSMPDAIEAIGKYLKRVVIDNLDEDSGIYSATVEFVDDGITVKRKMVPSHAIFLARLTNKPIYVKRKLVDQQEMYYSLYMTNEEDHEYSDEEL
ncbi:MAG: hypothetical protein B6U89_03120 [Desulfurococcales archaeon ex4484_58]|nr:MAG: hypothetical protein B6U89_03120 [Desulfurococcales archaeon ex4484_58]